MADKKITELTNITGAEVADTDELVVVDASASETKAITFAEFKTALDSGTGFVRITGDTMTGGLTVPTVDINGGTIDGAVIGGTTPAAITGTTITGTSFVTTGDMTFGDNDKAIFGAGSDLQIYHDGLNSVIADAGTGNLLLTANDFRLQNTTQTQNMISANDDGAVSLFYNGSQKLATTSTGAAVTGSLDVTDAATTRTNIDVDQAGTALALAIALG